MRIIGGRLKGHRFTPPKNTPARPTTDMAKEGLFNMLYNTYDFSALRVLDLFGGTGSISYEFASRGCNNITLVEIDKGNLKFIHNNNQKYQLGLQIVAQDVLKFIRTGNCQQQYDIIFAGPPYAMPQLATLPDLIFEFSLLATDGLFILEHNPNHKFTAPPRFTHSRNYGTTIFSFFS